CTGMDIVFDHCPATEGSPATCAGRRRLLPAMSRRSRRRRRGADRPEIDFSLGNSMISPLVTTGKGRSDGLQTGIRAGDFAWVVWRVSPPLLEAGPVSKAEALRPRRCLRGHSGLG